MKIPYGAWLVGSVAFLGFVSCEKKAEPTTKAEAEEKSVVEEVVGKVKEAVTGAEAPKLSAEERAAKLGFVKYLPKDTEVSLSFYNARQTADELKALKIWALIEEGMGAGGIGGMGADGLEEGLEDAEMLEEDGIVEDENADLPEAAQPNEEDAQAEEPEAVEPPVAAEGGPGPWTLLGQEVTIALGKTAGVQVGHLLKLNRRMAYFQARSLGKAAQSFAETGSMEDFSATMMKDLQGTGILTSLLEDPESGTKLLEDAEMPPLYLAFRAKEGELEQAAQLLNSGMSFFGMAGEMAVPVEFETGGAKLAGYKLVGEAIVKTMEAEREKMEEDLSPATVDALLSALRKKNLFVVTGTIGDYVVMLVGGSEESLALVSEIKESLVASDELNFADAFADKKLISVIYGQKETYDALIKESGGLADYALGLRDGISGGESLGDTRDLQGLLEIISDREAALMKLAKTDDLGMVAFAEEGLKIESFGGYDSGAVDWKGSTTLAHLGDSGDNLLFVNAPSSAAYDEAMGGYVEAILETAYAVTMKVSELNLEAPEVAQVKEYAKLFDEKFRQDVVGVWEALSGDFADGIGSESAVIIDLKGSIPAVPGIPQSIVDQGKAPRMTLIAPVKDRSKLASSWEKINGRATSILQKVSEMAGEDIPMQKAISSEKDGMTTWFFSFPFFDNDFLPSVTVSDKWFAASTSKTQALDLVDKAAAGGAKGEGVRFLLNFNALTAYAGEMLEVVDKNSGEVFTSESDLADFNKNKAQLKQVIDVCGEFDSLKWTAKEENGRVRSSMHFKTK
ncbi:MAG: hypothetical protein H7Y36_06650 [Armatimonadetes bacterium]|nr:hypothetical protein [Akkermansiaceae bacterium]